MVKEMLAFKEDEPNNPETAKAITQILDICAKREKVSPDQVDTYTRYIISRLSHDELVRQFGVMAVPTTILDRVFGLGPGLANPTPDKITEDQFSSLEAELTKVGIKVEALPQHAATMMGSYVAVTGEMYRDMAAVR